MRRYCVSAIVLSFVLSGCSVVVEPHLVEERSLPQVESKQSMEEAGILQGLLEEREDALLEYSSAPSLGQASSQESIAVMNVYLSLPVELINSTLYFLELYGIDCSSVESVAEVSDGLYCVTLGTGSKVEISLRDDYMFAGSDTGIFLCLKYDGSLVESCDGLVWRNYEGCEHNYSPAV